MVKGKKGDAPSWGKDPYGRHAYRWWDGEAWSDAVQDRAENGEWVPATDPPGDGPAGHTHQVDDEEQTAFRLPAVAPNVAELLVDRLVAFRPVGNTSVDTDYGPKPAIECLAIEITEEGDDKGYIDFGTVNIMWQHVMTELRQATPAVPWVAGVLTKRTKAYFLNPPRPSDVHRIAMALKEYAADRRPAGPPADPPAPTTDATVTKLPTKKAAAKRVSRPMP